MRRLLLFTAFFFSLSLQIFAQSNQTVASGGTTTAINFGGAGCYYSWTNSNPSIGLPATGAGNILPFTAISYGSSPITATITATPAPAGFAYITNNGASVNSVSVINVATNLVVATIPVGYNPDNVAVNHEGTLVYVGNDAGKTISVISTETNTVTSTISINGPASGIALSPDDSKLYVSNGVNVVVINTSDNSTITSFTLGQYTRPANLALSADGSKLYISNFANNDVFVVNTATYAIIADYAVGYNPHGIALSPDGSRLYVPTGIESIYQPVGINDDLEVVNTANGSILATIPVGQGPYNVTLNTDGSRAYVANSISNSVTVINTTNYQVVATIPAGPEPNGLCSTADGSEIFVTNNLSNNVSVINTANNTVTNTITTGPYPASVGNFITPASNCSGSPVTLTITVNPSATPPVIITGTPTGTISSCTGVASAYPNIQQFTVSGNYLTANVTATAPPGFEVSLTAGSGYAGSVILNQTSGILNSTIVYVRSAAGDAAGQISGNVVFSSTGAANQNVAVSGTVNALPAINTVPNQAINAGTATTAVNFTGTGGSFTWTNDTPSIGLSGSGTGNIGSFTAINNTNTAVVATVTVTPVNAGFGYVVNNISNTVTKFNLITNTIAATIPVDQGPIAVCVSPGGVYAYVTNAGSNTVSVINTNSNSIIADIPVGGSPQQIAISPDGGKVYVANYNGSSISVISTATNTVISTINLGAGFLPNGMVFSPDGSTLYVANTSGQSISTINTANYAINFNTILMGRGPTCLAISPDGSRLFTYNQQDGTISEVNPLTNTQILVIPAHDISSLAVSKDGKTLYSVGVADNNLNMINTSTGSSTFVPVDESVHDGLSLSADGAIMYVTNYGTKSVSVINLLTNALVATVPAGLYPIGDAISTNQSCPGAPTTFTITVNPTSTPATITAGPVTGTITACAGTASASPNIQQFTVNENIVGITATAPTGFEVSLDGTNYSNSVIINHSLGSGGTPTATVYVRSSASDAAGPISGNVVLTSPGAANLNVAVSGTVNALPTVNAVANQTLNNGSVTEGVNFTGTGNLFTWTNDTPSIGLAASGSGNIAAFTAVNNTKSPITATINVTPKLAGFAYIPISGTNEVSVINTANNQIVTNIPVGNDPFGVSVNPVGNRIYISNALDNTISVIDPATNSEIAIIPVGTGPIGISESPDGSRVYVANSGSDNVSIINAATNTVISTLPTGMSPDFTLVSPDNSRLYVSNQNGQSISVFNINNYNLITNIALPNNPPYQMVISADGNTLYAVTLADSPLLYVINTKTYAILTTIPIGQNAHGLVLSIDGSKLYVTNTGINTISVISTATNSIIATIPVGAYPDGISITSDGNYLYAINQGNTTGGPSASIISTITNQVVNIVTLGTAPIAMGNFITSGTSCPGTPTTFTITVNPASTPVTITAGPVTGTITACAGTASESPNIQQFTVSGSGLSANITATSPTNWEISLDPNTGYGSSLTIPQSGGVAGNTVIYVRSAAVAAAGNLSGNIVLSSTGATTQYVAVSSVVNALPIVDAMVSQTLISGTATSPINFTGTATTFNWVNDSPGIGLAANGTGDIASFTAINNTANPVTAGITITPLNNTGCSGTPIIFTITVDPVPAPGTLTATANLSPLATIYGTPSSAEDFTVSGTNISGGILVTPPAGFEVSGNGTSFNSTTSISGSGTIPSATVYIRLAAKTPVGNYSGNIVLSTSNVASVNVPMPVSTVSPAPLTVTANNLTKPYGANNPDLTVTYVGFVNNDGPRQLDPQPDVSTIATAQSPVGQYPILVDGAGSANYTFTYVPGVLTIEPALSATSIPNTFTPNGDGINDTWEIKYLSDYPKSTVNIFDRWGQKVFTSVGYLNPWDGRYKGIVVPSGTYYYVIDPKNGQQPLSGWLAIIR